MDTMTAQLADQLKKGRTYTTGYRDALVLDTFRHYAFCEVTGINQKFYDICTAAPGLGGRIFLHESNGMVGHSAGFVDGSGRQPLSRDQVERRWTDFIVSIGAKEAQQREAAAAEKKRQDAAAEKNKQKLLANEFRDKCAAKLRTMAMTMPFDKFINSKDARSLYIELGLAVFYNNKQVS